MSQTAYRTHHATEVTEQLVGQKVTLAGWVDRRRDHGGVAFIDLRDNTGLVQVVIYDEEMARPLRSEFVIQVVGEVRLRPDGNENEHLATGKIEVVAESIEVLAKSDALPFQVSTALENESENKLPGEDVRLKYRYLDLRRPSMQRNLKLRAQMSKAARHALEEMGFEEIETPTMIKSTPEGARDYLVPSRVQPGHFYALPQSPQLYKQILMLSGFDRYFQIARCYRDEDLRADRQPEFTQVDEEMSFVNEDDIMTINEGLIKRLWKEMLGVDVQTPFVRMPWDEAMGRFGSDKPDTRFGLEIVDVTDIFDGTEFKPFAAVLEQGGSIRAINAKGLAGKLTRKHIDKLGEVAKTYGAKGLAFSRLTEEGTSSSFEKFLTEEEKAADPAKKDTGLFFFRGGFGEKFAVCSAGGGFAYVGAMHDSFPHALELSKQGYNAFALIYRPGAQTACEDLARAISFIFENAEELKVNTDCYSLWGGSAGARMAAWLGSYGPAAFGGDDLPQPVAVIMQYTGHSDYTENDPPTYACVGERDGIADWRTMQRRLDTMSALGIPTEFHHYPGLPHGFGLGTGTAAEGWLDEAVSFWEAQTDAN